MTIPMRIKGGEKNSKSRQKWTNDELRIVLDLFIKDTQLKIHESNLEIRTLAFKLERTSRSVEAQLLMFRNLDRFGFYGFKNMNTISKVLWKEHISQQVK